MSRPVILAVAPNGARRGPADHPRLPLAAEAIAEEVAAAAAAGASMAHVHARTPDGGVTQDAAAYAAIIKAIRARCDIAVQVSVGDPLFTTEQALAPLALRPESASLPLRAAPAEIRHMLRANRAAGSLPQMDGASAEAIGVGAAIAAEAGGLAAYGLMLRDTSDMRDAANRLLAMSAALPSGAPWFAAKGGAAAEGVAALAVALGGHLRTGLEDVLPADPAIGNAALIARWAAIIRALGHRPATPAEARAILGIAA